MPPHSRKRNPPATRRRALELLAESRDGCTEAIMVAHGFTIPQMVERQQPSASSLAARRIEARVMTERVMALLCCLMH
jgi:hypothetical protein